MTSVSSRSELIIQRDHRIVLTPGDGREELVDVVRWCSQLRRIVAESYVFELSPLAIWGAASRGVNAVRMLDAIDHRASTPIPKSFRIAVIELFERYGALRMVSEAGETLLLERQPGLVERLGLDLERSDRGYRVPAGHVGRVSLACVRSGWPVVDEREPTTSTSVRIRTRNDSFKLRPYQQLALEAFQRAGSGIIQLPCGAGKTVIGIRAMIEAGRRTLILTPSREIGSQWQESLLAFTDIEACRITSHEPPGGSEAVAIATYQAATAGQVGGVLLDQSWGLVIYDEVQALPAEVFRMAASLPATRRLGLTATLVREDGRERDTFALVGPPVFEASWRDLERQGWIAPAQCYEVRFPVGESDRESVRRRVAVVERLLARHDGESVLVIGTRLDDLNALARRLKLPLITGSTSHEERRRIYGEFRAGHESVIALSKVGGVGVDLPNASVLIQISGNFGSRQEEAQRLGRILRPAPGKQAAFYSVVAAGSREEDFAQRRQRYLVDRGYDYVIIDASELPRVSRSRQQEVVPRQDLPTAGGAQTTDRRDAE